MMAKLLSEELSVEPEAYMFIGHCDFKLLPMFS